MNTKKILGSLAVLAIAATAAWNVSVNNREDRLSDVSIENVEALAEEWPSENGQTAMIMDCYDSRGNRKGTRRLCFSPGYSTNCTSTSC